MSTGPTGPYQGPYPPSPTGPTEPPVEPPPPDPPLDLHPPTHTPHLNAWQRFVAWLKGLFS
jgi:hypothetical protein